MIVVDASVVLKWFFPDEENYKKSLAVKQRHVMGEELIAAPELLSYEVANILLRQGEWQTVIESFTRFASLDIALHSLEGPQLTQALELAYRHKITVYDASYIALAQALRCRFVTADGRLLSRLRGVPRVLHLRELRAG